jgi:hypothetical protein
MRQKLRKLWFLGFLILVASLFSGSLEAVSAASNFELIQLWTSPIGQGSGRSLDISKDGKFFAFLVAGDARSIHDRIGIFDAKGSLFREQNLACNASTPTFWLDATGDMEFIAITTEPGANKAECSPPDHIENTGVELYQFGSSSSIARKWGHVLKQRYETKEVRVSENKKFVCATTSSGTDLRCLNLADGSTVWNYDVDPQEQFPVDGDDNLNYLIGATVRANSAIGSQVPCGPAPQTPCKWFVLKNQPGQDPPPVLAQGNMNDQIDDVDSTKDASNFVFGADSGEYVLLSRTGDTIQTVLSGNVNAQIDAIEVGQSTFLIVAHNNFSQGFIRLLNFQGIPVMADLAINLGTSGVSDTDPQSPNKDEHAVIDYDNGYYAIATSKGEVYAFNESGAFAQKTLVSAPPHDVRIENRYVGTITDRDAFLFLINTPPVVDAGSDKTVHIKSIVSLNGSVSDPDGDTTTCEWIFGSKPAGSQSSFSDPKKLATTFTPDVVDTQDASNPNRMTGSYVAKLTCTDSFGAKGEDTAIITATNDRPNADPGTDRPVLECDRFQLDGSGSSDPDGDKIALSWAIEAKPAPSKAVLSNSTSSRPNSLADAEGLYTFKLTVNDGTGAPNAEDTAEVTITAVANPFCSVKNVVTNIDLLFNELNHEFYETVIAINNGRKLLNRIKLTAPESSILSDLIVPASSVRLVEDSLEDALTQIDLTLAKFAELQGLLDQLHEQLGSTLGIVQSMLEDPDLTPAQVANLTKMKLKVESIELFAAELSNELESLQDRVDDGEPGEDPADDLKEVLEAAQEALAGDDLDGSRAALNLAYQLTRTALRKTKRLVRKKKLLIMSLVGAEAALRRSTVTSQNEAVSTVPALRELGKGFAISETSQNTIRFQTLDADVKSLRVQLYAMNGRSFFDRTVLGNQLSFTGTTSEGQPLANGVYLVVLTMQQSDGSHVVNKVQKIVWRR